MKTYSTSAYRAFKNFVGELTATAAGVQIGTNLAVKATESILHSDPWRTLGVVEGIHVCGLRSPAVQLSTARLNIVSLYSGFDLFIANIRAQHFRLHGKEWRQHEGDTPFQEIFRNSSTNKSALEGKLNACRIATVDYYRLVRNAVAHPSSDNVVKAKMFYIDNATRLAENRLLYGMRSAPNDYDQLSFHDVKALAQTALDLCEEVDSDLDPGDDRLVHQIPQCFKREPKTDSRIRHSVAGWLRNSFGIRGERADRIVQQYMTHELVG